MRFVWCLPLMYAMLIKLYKKLGTLVIIVCSWVLHLFDYIDSLKKLNRFFKVLLKCLVLGLTIFLYIRAIDLIAEIFIYLLIFLYKFLSFYNVFSVFN